MTTTDWRPATAGDVQVGDVIKARGVEIIVSRIETEFLGRPGMIAIIQDTPERWFKAPMTPDAPVEIAGK
jgi:hypothetical protein